MICIIEAKNDKKKNPLLEELIELQHRGLKLLLEGRPCSAQRIADVCNRYKKRSYMRDYVADDAGKIKVVDFNQIRI